MTVTSEGAAAPESMLGRLRTIWEGALRTSYFGSHVLLATGTSLFIGVLGLFTGLLVARMLGPESRGELAAIQSWPLLLITAATLGLHEATIYFVSRDAKRTLQYLTSAVLLSLAASIPAVIIGYLLMPLLLHAQTATTIAAARWYLLVVPLSAVVSMPMGALRGRRDMVAWNAIRIATPVGWLLLLLLALYTGHATAHWLAAGFIVLTAVIAVGIWTVARRRIHGEFTVSRGDWKPMLRFGLPTMASQTPMVLNLRLDQMLMAALLAPELLGLYAVAIAWSTALSPLLSGIGIVVFPMVAASSKPSEQVAILAQGTRLGVAAAAFIGVGLAALAPIAIPALFGADFAPAVPAAMILVLAAVVAELNGILRDGARGLGHTTAILVSEIVGLGAAVVALAFLLRPLGIIGAAIASVCGYGAATVALLFPIVRTTDSSVAHLLIPRLSDLSLIRSLLGRMLDERSAERPGRRHASAAALFLSPSLFTIRNVLHSRMLPALQRLGFRAHVLTSQDMSQVTIPHGTTIGQLRTPHRRRRGLERSARDMVQRASFYRRFALTSDRMTLWWYRRNLPWAERAAYATFESLAVLGSRSPFYEQQLAMMQRAKRRAWDTADARRELDQVRPAVVVATSCIDQIEEPYLMAARDVGIPTLGCIQSFDHLTGRSLPAPCDHYAVWNERMKAQLIHFHGVSDASRVHVTGTAQFDFHRRPEFHWSREQTLAHLGLEPGDRYILYATNTEMQTPSEPQLVQEYARRLAGIPALRDHRIVVRLHPLGVFDRWAGIAAEHPRLVVSLPSVASERFISPDDQARLVSSLAHADVCLNMWSSMSLDAAAVDTPVICVAFAGQRPSAEDRFCRMVYNTDYYRPIVESGGVRVAGDMDVLLAETAAYVADRNRDREQRQQMALQECGPLDGRSAERIASLIADLAGESQAAHTDCASG